MAVSPRRGRGAAIQPQPVSLLPAIAIERGHRQKLLAFELRGVAVEDGVATAAMLKKLPRELASRRCMRRFDLVAFDAEEWTLINRSGTWNSRGASPEGSWRDGYDAFGERVAAVLRSDFFSAFAPEKMLGAFCLCCGKQLTDPASMARRIGPECAATPFDHRAVDLQCRGRCGPRSAHMAENTDISWADHTFNPWWGCSHVSPACDHCYAEVLNRRFKLAPGWGPGVPRHRLSEDYWKGPRRWNRKAERTGYRPLVFCASMADVFDNEVDPSWRDDLWALVRETPYLRWIF